MHNVRVHILKKLYAYGAFSNGHLLSQRLHRGVPAHLRGDAKRELGRLVKDGLVLEYPTLHGMAYQLNIERLNDIEHEMFGER